MKNKYNKNSDVKFIFNESYVSVRLFSVLNFVLNKASEVSEERTKYLKKPDSGCKLLSQKYLQSHFLFDMIIAWPNIPRH